MTELNTELTQEFTQLVASAAIRTLEVQCKLKATLQSSFRKGEKPQNAFEIGAMLGVTNPTLRGSVTLCFSKPVFLKILQELLLDPTISEITSENQDAAAEILNIVSAHVKTILNKKNHEIRLSIPSVIRGQNIESQYAKNQIVQVHQFHTDIGEFYAEMLFNPLDQAETTAEKASNASSVTPAPMLTPAEKAAFFIPFLNGTIQTLKVQFSIDAKPGKPFDKVAEYHYPFDLAGVVGITSKAVTGSYVVVFKQAVFLKLASKIFNEEYTTLEPGLEDLVAELVNMSLGAAKSILNEKGHGIQMAIPTVIKGTNIQTNTPKDRRVIVIPVTSEIGEFHVEIDFQS